MPDTGYFTIEEASALQERIHDALPDQYLPRMALLALFAEIGDIAVKGDKEGLAIKAGYIIDMIKNLLGVMTEAAVKAET